MAAGAGAAQQGLLRRAFDAALGAAAEGAGAPPRLLSAAVLFLGCAADGARRASPPARRPPSACPALACKRCGRVRALRCQSRARVVQGPCERLRARFSWLAAAWSGQETPVSLIINRTVCPGRARAAFSGDEGARACTAVAGALQALRAGLAGGQALGREHRAGPGGGGKGGASAGAAWGSGRAAGGGTGDAIAGVGLLLASQAVCVPPGAAQRVRVGRGVLY